MENNNTSRSGITLMEIIVALILFGVFVFLFLPVMSDTEKFPENLHKAADAIPHLDPDRTMKITLEEKSNHWNSWYVLTITFPDDDNRIEVFNLRPDEYNNPDLQAALKACGWKEQGRITKLKKELSATETKTILRHNDLVRSLVDRIEKLEKTGEGLPVSEILRKELHHEE